MAIKSQTDHIKEAYENGCSSITLYYTDQWSKPRFMILDTWLDFVRLSPNKIDYFKVNYD